MLDINIKIMNGSDNNPVPKNGRLIFGIIMVLIYLAVGLLFILQVFSIWNAGISITVGILLIIYGIWRGYRLYIGSN